MILVIWQLCLKLDFLICLSCLHYRCIELTFSNDQQLVMRYQHVHQTPNGFLILSLVLVIPKLLAHAALEESWTAVGCLCTSGQLPRSAPISVAMGSWALVQNAVGFRC